MALIFTLSLPKQVLGLIPVVGGYTVSVTVLCLWSFFVNLFENSLVKSSISVNT